jgi:putative sigma-54 modulation protein
MQIETYGHDIDVTPALREYVDSKLQRLGRHLERPFDVRVQLSLDKPHHKAEANLVLAGKAMHADASAIDMYAAIDLLADKLDRLVIKQKEKTKDHHRGESAARSDSFG